MRTYTVDRRPPAFICNQWNKYLRAPHSDIKKSTGTLPGNVQNPAKCDHDLFNISDAPRLDGFT
jgi:hypothetical protein